MDSLSYALGVLFATNLSNEGLSSVDGESLKSGFQATLAGDATMSASEADALVRMEMTKLKEQQAQAAKAEVKRSSQTTPKKKASTPRPRIAIHPHRGGHGASPDANDEVTVHYRGTLLDGTEFDSSFKEASPFHFH